MLQTSIRNNTYTIDNKDGNWQINDADTELDIQFQPNGLISIIRDGKSYTALVESVDHKAKELKIRVEDQVYTIAIKEEIDQLLESMGLDLKAMQKAEPIKAPMPGKVLKILVTPGQQIEKGDGLLILEAMKMENILKATAPATVKAINIEENTAVEKDTVLIELE
ncbi:MAG: acetyl-CoA carboxylase biotin carboxyl carrier protein subunit [Flavipsychrobacter sp.]